MSLREITDTVNSIYKEKQNDVYALSSMVRVAVLSCFSDSVKFPASPEEAFGGEEKENWKNSANFMKALAEQKRRCRK